MVQAQKKKKSRVADIINQLLEDVNKARTGDFTPENVALFIPTGKEMASYERAGLKAREERESELVKATPKRVVPKQEERMVLDRQMNEKAFGDAVNLATILERAAAEGRKFNLTKWTKT